MAFATVSIATLPVCGFADNAFSGLQAGAVLGYEGASIDWETQFFTSPTPQAEKRSTLGDDSESMNDSAFSYGVFTGYNLAISQKWIVGVELEFQDSDLSDSINFIPGFDDSSINSTSAEIDVNATYLLGLKGGYLLNESTMVYSTLSATRTEVESSSFCPSDGFICNPGSAPKSFKDDDDINGWALGVGVEKSLTSNLSIKAEYRYADLGTAKLSPVTNELAESFGVEADVDVVSQTLQVGAAYSF